MSQTPGPWREYLKTLQAQDHPVAFWAKLATDMRAEKERIPEFVLRRARLWFVPSWRKLGVPEGH